MTTLLLATFTSPAPSEATRHRACPKTYTAQHFKPAARKVMRPAKGSTRPLRKYIHCARTSQDKRAMRRKLRQWRRWRRLYFCPSGGTIGANIRLGRCMARKAGWTGPQWRCLRSLGHRESGWDHTARNSSSGAYGIPQALGHGNIGSDPKSQIRWFIRYVRGRYGTACAALGHFNALGWY